MMERRLNKFLHEYWTELKGDSKLPKEDDIDPDVLKQVWDSCFLIQVRDIELGHDYSFSYLGADIKHAYGHDLDEMDAPPLVSEDALKLHSDFSDVILSKEPGFFEDQFTSMTGAVVNYRQSLFPLSNDGENVHSILGGMRYQVVMD